MLLLRGAGSSLALTLALLAGAGPADAQPAGKVPRVGYLVLSPLVDPPTPERQAFLDTLRELGYEVGKDLIVEYRAANWNRELLPDLAEELVERKVDVIVAVAGTVEAARQATKTLPIVLVGASDPVEQGLVASLSRPGGNLTGIAWSYRDIAGKRLEILKEALPKLSRVAVLWNPANQASVQIWKETQAGARVLGVTLQSYEVPDPKDFPPALEAMSRRRPDALITIISPLINAYRPIIVEFGTKHRLPTMFDFKADVEAGGLMAYTVDIPDMFRRVAVYVDRILKGAKPADLPIEQPSKFELIVNLRTAKALGLKIPPSILVRAHQLIQ